MSMLLTLILNNIFVIVFIFLLYFFHFLPCSSGVHSLDIIALNIGNTEAENIPTTTSINKQLQNAIWHLITNSKYIVSFSSNDILKILSAWSLYASQCMSLHVICYDCMLKNFKVCLNNDFIFFWNFVPCTFSIVYILILSNTLYCSCVCKTTNLMLF